MELLDHMVALYFSFFLIVGLLLYNIVLVSAIYQHESVIGPVTIFYFIFFKTSNFILTAIESRLRNIPQN